MNGSATWICVGSSSAFARLPTTRRVNTALPSSGLKKKKKQKCFFRQRRMHKQGCHLGIFREATVKKRFIFKFSRVKFTKLLTTNKKSRHKTNLYFSLAINWPRQMATLQFWFRARSRARSYPSAELPLPEVLSSWRDTPPRFSPQGGRRERETRSVF